MENKTTEKIKGILFLIFFVGAIFGMIIFAETQPSLCFSCFGAILYILEAKIESKRKLPKAFPCIYKYFITSQKPTPFSKRVGFHNLKHIDNCPCFTIWYIS